MKAASIKELKTELKETDRDRLIEICLRLSRFKKENKELLTYMLFEAANETDYIASVKAEIANAFEEVPVDRNTYFVKKSLRKILRMMNRYVRYTEVEISEIELRIFFCLEIIKRKIPRAGGTVIGNIYEGQKKKISTIFKKLPDDLQADYAREVKAL